MANPLTCLHKILAPGITREGKPFTYCVSCDIDVSGTEIVKERLYNYDIDHNVWVHVPGKRVKRT